MTKVQFEAPISTLDPFDEAFLNDPYEGHDQLRELGPVVYLERYGIWAMARNEQVKAALNDPATFCSSAGVGLTDFRKEPPWRPTSLLLEADPPAHSVARRVMSSVLSPTAVRQLREDFVAEAQRLFDGLNGKEEFDAIIEIAQAFPLKVFPDAVGLPVEGREHLLPYASTVFNAYGPMNALRRQSLEGAEEVAEWITARCQPDALAPESLGAKLHTLAASEGWPVERAALLVRSLLSAGVDTTVSAIGNVLYCLALHPDQYALLRSEPSRTRAAFEESLRVESTAQTFFRTTTREVEVGDVIIPEGEKVLLFLAAANRDPRVWERPETFDITRRAAGQLGFGAGIHVCVGQMMARLEGEVVVSELIKRVAIIEMAGTPIRKLNNSLRGLASLPVRVSTA